MKKMFLGILVGTLALSSHFYGYEDHTHQELTKKAIEFALIKGVPEDFFKDSEIMAIVNGAGMGPGIRGGGEPNKYDGEDYTAYYFDEEYSCKDNRKVRKYVCKTESFSHFENGMFDAKSAEFEFRRFFNDAVALWEDGNKIDAAFILGRACHLVEDMAQPQHAMNEAHLDKKRCGIPPNISFLEEYTEAIVKGNTNDGDFCAQINFDYNRK